MDSGCWGRGTSHALAIKTNFAWCRPQVETKGAGVGLRPYFASAISTDSGATWSAPTLHV